MKSFFQRKQTRSQLSSKSSSDHKFSLPPSQETYRQTPAPSTYDGKQKAYDVPSHSTSKKDTYSPSTYKAAPTQSNDRSLNMPQWMPPAPSSHRRDDDRARESRRSDQHRHRHRERGAETDVEKVASKDARRDKEKRREPSRHRDAEYDSKSRHYYSESERDLYRKPGQELNPRTQHRDRRNESSSRRGPYDEGDSSDDSRRKLHKSSNHRRHRTTDAVFGSDYDSKFMPFTTPSASSEKPGREDLPVHLPIKSVKMQSLENEDPHGSASETERIRHRETRHRHKDTTSQLPEHRPSASSMKAHHSTRQPKTGSESRVMSSRPADNMPDRKKSMAQAASESTGQPYAQAVPASGLTGPVPTAYQLPFPHALQESAPQSGVATSSSMSSYHTTLSSSRQGAQGTSPTTSSESPASMRKNQFSFPSSDPALHQSTDGRTSRNPPIVSTPSAGSQRDAHRQYLSPSADSNTPQSTLNPSSPNKVPGLISKFESLSATATTPSAMATPVSPRPPSAIGFKQSLDRTLAPPMFASMSQQKTSQQPNAFHRTDAYTSPTPKASENVASADINLSPQATYSHSGSRSTNITGSKQNTDHEEPPPTGWTSPQPSHYISRLNATDQARIMISNASQPQTLSPELLAPSIRQTPSAVGHPNDDVLSLANDYRTYAASGSSTKKEIPHPWAPSSENDSRDPTQPSNAVPYVSAPFATSGHHVRNQSQTSSGQANTIQTSHMATSVKPKSESKWTSALDAQHHSFTSPNTHTSTPAAPKTAQWQPSPMDAKVHARHDSSSVPTASRSGTEYEKTVGNPQRDNSLFKAPQKALFQHPKLAEIMSSAPTATPVPTDTFPVLPSRPSYEGRPSLEDQLRTPQIHQHLASFHHDRDGISPVYSSASKQAAEKAESSRVATVAKPPSPSLHHRQSKLHWHTPPSPGAVQTPISTPSSRHSPASISRPYDFRTGHGGSPSLHKASSRESYTSVRIYTPPNVESTRVQVPEAQSAPNQTSPLQPSYYRTQSYEGQTAPLPAQASSPTWRHDESASKTYRTVSFTSSQSQPQTSSRHAKTQDKSIRPDEPSSKTNPHPSGIDVATSYQSPGSAKHSVSIGSAIVSDIKPRSSRNQPHYPHPSPPLKLSQNTSEESILLTPSSLAPSMLKPTISRSSVPASVSSQNETKKKSGFLGIFRGKQPAADPYEIWYPPEMNSGAAPPASQPDGKVSSRVKVPRAITIPGPNQPISERKSPNKAVFTPFRYLTSRRHRTVSAASVEALNGTAPNTVIGSPTASMHSQNPMQPPLRDPLVATQEWRDEMGSRRGGKKIQRPGVVFDVKEEPSEDKHRLKPVRSRQSGANGLTSRPG